MSTRRVSAWLLSTGTHLSEERDWLLSQGVRVADVAVDDLKRAGGEEGNNWIKRMKEPQWFPHSVAVAHT